MQGVCAAAMAAESKVVGDPIPEKGIKDKVYVVIHI